MADLLLHPTTDHQLKALLQSPPHALLISGMPGMGKEAIAWQMIEQLLGATRSSQYVLHVAPENGSVGIEAIRRIRDFVSRKTTGQAAIRRIILVTEAHTMTTEAQNALLKVLEEPPADTMLILTANAITGLKPTIRSRSQLLLVLPVSQAAAESFFGGAGYPVQKIQTAYYMSDGRTGLLRALLDGAEDHELVGAISEAKDILKMPVYERLLRVEALSKEKENLTLLLQGLERVVTSGLRQAADKSNHAAVKKFYQLGQLIQQTQSSLTKNGNAKLVLTNLFLNM